MFDKITDRIKLCYGLNDLVDAVKVAMRVIEGLYDGVSTSLDNLAAETAASMTIAHPDYAQCSENCDFKSAFQYNKIIFGNNDRNV
jgi:ribonucleoside-diphosphate reductase alpha chain